MYQISVCDFSHRPTTGSELKMTRSMLKGLSPVGPRLCRILARWWRGCAFLARCQRLRAKKAQPQHQRAKILHNQGATGLNPDYNTILAENTAFERVIRRYSHAIQRSCRPTLLLTTSHYDVTMDFVAVK